MVGTGKQALDEAGAPLEVISKVTGHSGGDVTRDHYLSVSAERTRREFETVADQAHHPQGRPCTTGRRRTRTKT